MFAVQFLVGLLKKKKKQAEDLAILHSRHFLSASPYKTGREGESYRLPENLFHCTMTAQDPPVLPAGLGEKKHVLNDGNHDQLAVRQRSCPGEAAGKDQRVDLIRLEDLV